MRRSLFFAVALALSICCLGAFAVQNQTNNQAAAEPAGQPNFYAVIIGVSQFEHLDQPDWLQFADADATDFYRFITSPRGRNFPEKNVFLLTNKEAGYQAIRSRMGSALARQVKPGDTVYIFIATHGMVEKDADREAYLLGYDSDREDLYDTALPMRELGNIIQNRLQKAGRVVLFADACRSGKLSQFQGSINRHLEDVSKQRGETIGLLASRPNEYSREGRQFGGGHGLFTYYLLKGLMGDADSDSDKTVTAQEIVSYLEQHVEAGSDRQQHVRDFGEFDNNTPFSFVDKPGPANLKLSVLQKLPLAEIASMQVMQSASADVRNSIHNALREGRLLAPAGDNAWDLYRQYERFPVPETDKDVVKDDVVIAMVSEGEKVLSAYRRGDQVIHLDASKYDQGAQLFDHASQLEPDDITLQSKAKFFAGRALVESRNYTQGVSRLQEAIRLDPEAAYSYNALGIAYMEQQRWNEAIANFKAASERAENWVYPHYNLARVYTGQKQYRQAEQEFKRGIEIGTDLGLKYSYLHYNLGILYLFQGRADDAEREFRRAIEMKPDDAMSYHNLGLVLERRGDSREAEFAYEKAAEFDRKLIEPRLKLAAIYHNQHQEEKEETVLRQAAEADPRNASNAELLGRFLLQNKQPEQAEKVYTAMLASGADPVAALVGLGDAHAAENRWNDAADDYRQAMTRSKDKKVLRDLEKKLRSAEKKR